MVSPAETKVLQVKGGKYLCATVLGNSAAAPVWDILMCQSQGIDIHLVPQASGGHGHS